MRREANEKEAHYSNSNAEFPRVDLNQGKQLLSTDGITVPTKVNTEICNGKSIFE